MSEKPESSDKREAARRKRNQRGWGMRGNASPSLDGTLEGLGIAEPSAAEAESAAVPAPAVPQIDRPASRSVFERLPPPLRWTGMVVTAGIVGVMVGANHSVQLGMMSGLAFLLAGAAFLAAYLPPPPRKRPGDSTAVGFGQATGHERDEPQSVGNTSPNRAARRRLKKDKSLE